LRGIYSKGFSYDLWLLHAGKLMLKIKQSDRYVGVSSRCWEKPGIFFSYFGKADEARLHQEE